MTLFDVLCLMRQRLLDDFEQDNLEDIYLMFAAFTILKEISYTGGDRRLTGLLVNFEDAAQEALNAAKGKVPIPSLEAIRAVFPSS